MTRLGPCHSEELRSCRRRGIRRRRRGDCGFLGRSPDDALGMTRLGPCHSEELRSCRATRNPPASARRLRIPRAKPRRRPRNDEAGLTRRCPARGLPLAVVFLDERELLRPRPALQLLLALDRGHDVLKRLEVDEPVDAVARGETLRAEPPGVLRDALQEVAGDSHVEHRPVEVRENVDGAGFEPHGRFSTASRPGRVRRWRGDCGFLGRRPGGALGMTGLGQAAPSE